MEKQNTAQVESSGEKEPTRIATDFDKKKGRSGLMTTNERKSHDHHWKEGKRSKVVCGREGVQGWKRRRRTLEARRVVARKILRYCCCGVGGSKLIFKLDLNMVDMTAVVSNHVMAQVTLSETFHLPPSFFPPWKFPARAPQQPIPFLSSSVFNRGKLEEALTKTTAMLGRRGMSSVAN